MQDSSATTSEPAPPARLAGGFALRREDGELIVDCPFPPPGWQARQPGDLVRADFPGTPLLHDGSYYEIVDIETRDKRFRYVLEPWDDRNLLRSPQSLDPETCRALWRAEQDRKARERRAKSLRVLLPLVGLLPARDQYRIEREYGLLAAHATMASSGIGAIFFLPTAFFGLIATFVSGFSGAFPGLAWTESWVVVLVYFAIESWARAHMAFANEQAAGSLPVVLIVELARALRRLRPS